MKFSYESQLDVSMLPVSAIKDSPPSSPGSEIGAPLHTNLATATTIAPVSAAASNVRKRGRKAKDATLAATVAVASTAAAAATQHDLKDVRLLQNGGIQPPVNAPTPPATPATGSSSSGSSSVLGSTTSAAGSIIAHTATHMLGNHVNPNSSVAQKLSEQLHMEVQDHSIYTSDSMNSQFMGVPFPGKQVSKYITVYHLIITNPCHPAIP